MESHIGLFYTGPETVMPLASAIAAIAGMLLVLWQRVTAWTRAAIEYSRRRWSPTVVRSQQTVERPNVEPWDRNA